ncbi:MAG: class II fructose-bisphosphate aldolase [Oscillospiraceae bacterium]
MIWAEFVTIVSPCCRASRPAAAKSPSPSIWIHTYSFELLMQALRAGFGSVMYDGSREKTSEENIRKSAEIVRIAHGMGVGVECELGSVGGLTDSNGKVDQMVYTEPEEAKSFVDQTGTDFLAVSIGTCHGVYKATPKLDIPRLREIRKTVPVPLVLHGGSGLSDDDFRNTVAGGISKINVFTDVILAAKRAIARASGRRLYRLEPAGGGRHRSRRPCASWSCSAAAEMGKA